MKRPRRRKKGEGGLVEVSELLEGALKALGVKGDFEKFRVEKKCREVLGEKISKALAGISFEKSVVRMEFNHSIWMQEVNFRKSEILKKIQEGLPDIGIKNLSLGLARSRKI